MNFTALTPYRFAGHENDDQQMKIVGEFLQRKQDALFNKHQFQVDLHRGNGAGGRAPGVSHTSVSLLRK